MILQHSLIARLHCEEEPLYWLSKYQSSLAGRAMMDLSLLMPLTEYIPIYPIAISVAADDVLDQKKCYRSSNQLKTVKKSSQYAL